MTLHRLDEVRGSHEVATISRLLQITGLFCRISYLLQGSFANETYNLKEPTSRSHPIVLLTGHVQKNEPNKRDYILQKRPVI